MLPELVYNLVTAADPEDKENVYRKFEMIGVDRKTADEMALEFR